MKATCERLPDTHDHMTFDVTFGDQVGRVWALPRFAESAIAQMIDELQIFAKAQ